ncbi:MAG: AsmA family protein, partial [Chitinophagaceae bacterium]|nr:AsmA family protein [Chitinophagaceae bacterium]
MKKLLRIAKISGLSLLGLVVVILLLPVLFPNAFASQIKRWASQHITGELRFDKARLSFFNHFPSLTLTLYDYSLTGAAPFAQDTLIAGKELAFGIDLGSVLSSTIRVDKFFIDQSQFNIQVAENGEANYNIYKNTDTATSSQPADSSSARLKIEGIYISNSRLLYHDRSLPMIIRADGLRYNGEADFANSVFDLVSEIEADSVDFVYDGTAYVERKQLKAELITGINTSSLAFSFQKNDILINQLPVDFTGSMTILDEGYDIDLAVVSGITDFGNVFSALPPAYNSWFANTRFSGQSQLTLDMKGSYRAASGQQPDLHMHLWVKDGLIQHKGAPAPLKDFFAGVDFRMPSLNTDSMVLQVDSLRFNLNGDATYLRMRSEGLTAPLLKGSLRSQLNLALLKAAMGLNGYDLKGQLSMNANTDGRFDGKRRQFAPTTASVVLSNGLIKTPYYPAGLENLQINSQLNASGGTYSGITIQVQPIAFSFDGQPFEARAQLRNLDDLQYDIDANGHLNLTNLYKLFAVDGYSISGLLKLAVNLHGKQSDATAGRYLQLKNSGTVACENVQLRSRDYPLPFVIPSGVL